MKKNKKQQKKGPASRSNKGNIVGYPEQSVNKNPTDAYNGDDKHGPLEEGNGVEERK